MACTRLAGRVVTVGDEMPVLAPLLAARTCAAAARCSAALLGLFAVMGDCCAPSLGACVSNKGHVTGSSHNYMCLTDGQSTHMRRHKWHTLPCNSRTSQGPSGLLALLQCLD